LDLTSDDYQVVGSVTLNNKILKDLNVIFVSRSVSGFCIMIEEHKNYKNIEG
jgi:hypothetical protein